MDDHHVTTVKILIVINLRNASCKKL